LQSLQQSSADTVLHIGNETTRGLGSGSNPDLGYRAAMEQHDQIKSLLKGADMVFIAAGSGGGTGTGAAPVVASIARELGALAVGIVTKPFSFKGTRRGEQADKGVEELSRHVDTLITIPNSRLLTVLDKRVSMVDAFRMADDVLRQGVQGISDLITLPGLINLDFADVRTIMSEAGTALLGIGMGVGEQRAARAAACRRARRTGSRAFHGCRATPRCPTSACRSSCRAGSRLLSSSVGSAPNGGSRRSRTSRDRRGGRRRPARRRERGRRRCRRG